MKGHRFKSKKPKANPPSQSGRVASPKRLQQMKSTAQARDRKLVAKGGAVDEMFLIHPDIAKAARITWPADD
jgi:hypothetical protein